MAKDPFEAIFNRFMRSFPRPGRTGGRLTATRGPDPAFAERFGRPTGGGQRTGGINAGGDAIRQLIGQGRLQDLLARGEFERAERGREAEFGRVSAQRERGLERRGRERSSILGMLNQQLDLSNEQNDPIAQLQNILTSFGFSGEEGGDGGDGGEGGPFGEGGGNILDRFIEPLLAQLVPSEERAGERLRSSILREGGPGALTSGAAGESQRRLQENILTRRGGLAAEAGINTLSPLLGIAGNLFSGQQNQQNIILNRILSTLGTVAPAR